MQYLGFSVLNSSFLFRIKLPQKLLDDFLLPSPEKKGERISAFEEE